MKKFTFELPAMYADHHVLEIRRILQELSGVKEVYASSAFHLVEVSVDGKTTKDQIKKVLEESGYLGELHIDVESGVPVNMETKKPSFFRHTGLYEEVLKDIGFMQKVVGIHRPLYPCPGIGPLEPKEMVD